MVEGGTLKREQRRGEDEDEDEEVEEVGDSVGWVRTCLRTSMHCWFWGMVPMEMRTHSGSL